MITKTILMSFQGMYFLIKVKARSMHVNEKLEEESILKYLSPSIWTILKNVWSRCWSQVKIVLF